MATYVGESRDSFEPKTLGTQLEERGFTPHKGTGGVRQWLGLCPINPPVPF